MIEDLQDELQEEKPRKGKARSLGRGAFLTIAFILWIPFAAVVGIISMPNAIVAVRESGVRSYIQETLKQNGLPFTHEDELCFVVPSSQGGVSYRLFSQDVPQTGETAYHDAIEGLLQGPGEDALATGAITFITQGTRLRGLTVSEGVVFIDFSGEFASSGSNWGPEGLEAAKKQIEYTIKAIDSSIRKVVIMMNGTVLEI